MKYELTKVVTVQDFNKLVVETYGRPYHFQQQGGCKPRGVHHFSAPEDEAIDFDNDFVPEKINGPEMGVSFKAWQERDPKAPVDDRTDYCIELWWHRNFYPCFEVLVNDLYSRGLIKKGNYLLEIDW